MSYEKQTKVYDGSNWISVNGIPDSVVFQHSGPTFASNDSTWTDDVANNDMAMTGDLQSSTLSNGNESVLSDGVDDYGQVTLPSEFEGALLNEFSIEVSIQSTATNQTFIFGRDDGSKGIQLAFNWGGNFNSDEGNIIFTLDDADGNALRFSPSTNPNLNDGNVHKISIIVNDATNNNAELYIDGSSIGITFSKQQSPNNFSNWTADMLFFGRDNAGGIESDYNGHIGINRWHDIAIDSPTI